MSIRDYIEKIKTKPEDEKKRAVFIWTTIIISLIFLIWVVTFSLSVANNQADLTQLQAEAEVSAKAQLITVSSTSPRLESNSIIARFGQFISAGAGAINEGFWTVGSWLHQ